MSHSVNLGSALAGRCSCSASQLPHMASTGWAKPWDYEWSRSTSYSSELHVHTGPVDNCSSHLTSDFFLHYFKIQSRHGCNNWQPKHSAGAATMLRPLAAPTRWGVHDSEPQALSEPAQTLYRICPHRQLPKAFCHWHLWPEAILWSLTCHLKTEMYIPIIHLFFPINNPFSTLCHSVLIPAATKTTG